MPCSKRWLSSPWQCTLPSCLLCLSLMPVQTPGIRPSDILYKNSTAVQGIEARVCCIPLTRICIAVRWLLWLPSVGFRKMVRKRPNIPKIGHLRRQQSKRCTLYRIAVACERRILSWKCVAESSDVGGKATNFFHSTLVTSLTITTSLESAPPGMPAPPRRYQCGDASLNQHCSVACSCHLGKVIMNTLDFYGAGSA
jgi:hypothetical protein